MHSSISTTEAVKFHKRCYKMTKKDIFGTQILKTWHIVKWHLVFGAQLAKTRHCLVSGNQLKWQIESLQRAHQMTAGDLCDCVDFPPSLLSS